MTPKTTKAPVSGACRFTLVQNKTMVLQVIRAEWQLARVSPLGPSLQALIRAEIYTDRGRFAMGNFDPRTICNLILDEADRSSRQITNLALQKLLYFAHGLHLVETKDALITGFFEAWQFGPVHPVAYHAFKKAQANAIEFRASIQDPFTHATLPPPECGDPDVRSRVSRIVAMYAGLTPGRLVEVSHAKDAPWRHVVDKAKNETILGLRIPNDVILSRFKYHKVSIGSEPRHGEPIEEIPFDSKEEIPPL